MTPFSAPIMSMISHTSRTKMAGSWAPGVIGACLTVILVAATIVLGAQRKTVPENRGVVRFLSRTESAANEQTVALRATYGDGFEPAFAPVSLIPIEQIGADQKAAWAVLYRLGKIPGNGDIDLTPCSVITLDGEVVVNYPELTNVDRVVSLRLSKSTLGVAFECRNAHSGPGAVEVWTLDPQPRRLLVFAGKEGPSIETTVAFVGAGIRETAEILCRRTERDFKNGTRRTTFERAGFDAAQQRFEDLHQLRRDDFQRRMESNIGYVDVILHQWAPPFEASLDEALREQ